MFTFDSDVYYLGYNEEIQLEEYEKLKKVINGKYGSNSTAFQIRTEFEKSFNRLFDSMMDEYSHRVFDIIFVMMDCFNINEKQAFRYLSEENKEKVRNFALNNYNTFYYEQAEKKKIKEKMEKKGQAYYEYIDAKDLFE